MNRLVTTACLFVSLSPIQALAQAQRPPAPAPNWNGYRYHDVTADVLQNGQWLARPTPTQIAFRFTLPNSYRQTSAAVFNSAGVLVRTLWTRRSYNAGTFGDMWDGLDDTSQVATGGPFTIKVVPNNISYDWLGLIGNTEDSWNGPDNWDGGPASFVTAAAFLDGKATLPAATTKTATMRASSAKPIRTRPCL